MRNNLGKLTDPAKNPDALCLIDCLDFDHPRFYSHGDIDRLADACARGLRKRGLNLQAVYKTIQKSGLTADVKKQALHQFAAWDEAFQVALRTAIREL